MENQGSGEILGVIYAIHPTDEITTKSGDLFKKRQFILLINGGSKYPAHIPFEVIKENCAKLDKFKVGDKVEVCYNIRGRIYDSKKTNREEAFLSLLCWRLYEYKADITAPVIQTTPAPDNKEQDELPF